ncbi:MAG: serine hydrolase domain-containing protein [Pseudomonadota bacterium]
MDDLSGAAPAAMNMDAARLDAIPDFFASAYISSGKLPAMATLVAREGTVVHEAYRGCTELGGNQSIDSDTIFRIYSMTKPITSVAAMMLFEAGAIRLDHEVSRYIPAFAGTEVFDGAGPDGIKTRPADRSMQVRDLFTHTSGLTYGFLMQTEVDALYREHKIARPDETLEAMCNRLAALPLVFSPGTRWNYGHSTDVLGRIVEVASGKTLDAFFRERIFGPLGMADTDFFVPEAKLSRLMACYARDPETGEISLSDGGGPESRLYRSQPPLLNAGGGLVSTPRDYLKFCQCLLNGGRRGDVRLLSPKTVEFMTLNHLPGNQTIKEMGDRTFSEARMEGNGFGLGGSVVVDVAETLSPGSLGTFSWGGLANTFFWIDPVEDLVAIQMTQMIPSGCFPIRPQFQQLVYAAIDG